MMTKSFNEELAAAEEDRSFEQHRSDVIDRLHHTKVAIAAAIERAQPLSSSEIPSVDPGEIRTWTKLHDRIDDYLQDLCGYAEFAESSILTTDIN